MLRTGDLAVCQLLRVGVVAGGFGADGDSDVVFHQGDQAGEGVVKAEDVLGPRGLAEPMADLILKPQAGRDDERLAGQLSELDGVCGGGGQRVVHAHEGDPGFLF